MTLRYIYELYSSEFVITNSRSKIFESLFLKKKSQKYIQTWHGAIPLKRIEKDAITDLSKNYIKNAKKDSAMCDLILSDTDFFTNLIRRSFWYDGEILQKGIPRNDIFFNKGLIVQSKEKIINFIGDKSEYLFVLYAPTFRNYPSYESFAIEWDSVISEIEIKFKKKVKVLLRLHPNSLKNVDISKLKSDSRIVDMCSYPDMQELLCSSDILITDYSSSMFDFAILHKPCFLYANDIELYNRGFYFDIRKLPFPLAENTETLVNNIKGFSYDLYKINVIKLFEGLGFIEDGNASKYVVEWMNSCIK